MKVPLQKDQAFMGDVRRVLAGGERGLWWLGQSGFLVVQNGRAIVLDPYLSDSLTRKYAETDKPHVRMTECVVAPAELATLGVIDLVTSSHNHTDHFDPETLRPLLRGNSQARLVIPAANRDACRERLGADFGSGTIELNEGKSAKIAGIDIFGIAAAHPTVERDKAGQCVFLGYVICWEGLTIYHSGDTLWHEGLVPALRPFSIDVALLPINGDRPERRVAGNLDGKQAAHLGHVISAHMIIPCHFDMFEFNTASPDEFVVECRKLGQHCCVLQQGEFYSL